MRHFFVIAMIVLAVGARWSFAQSQTASSQMTTAPSQPVVLDRVIAIINGDVLLESDVQEEEHFALLEPFRVSANTDTLQRAARRLINRTMILQQMKEQQTGLDVTDEEVQKSLLDMRQNLPACQKYDCKTDEGWKAFLAANDLTEQEVQDHWRQRLRILKFIDIRFRIGIRISHEEVEDYYQKSIVPSFEKQKQKAPPVETIDSKIQEVLLQQHVNGLLQDWLKSLRTEGSVQILDPAYGQSSGSSDGEDS
jgi:peptidyl-prolyl cis-trans isomerase SurA